MPSSKAANRPTGPAPMIATSASRLSAIGAPSPPAARQASLSPRHGCRGLRACGRLAGDARHHPATTDRAARSGGDRRPRRHRGGAGPAGRRDPAGRAARRRQDRLRARLPARVVGRRGAGGAEPPPSRWSRATRRPAARHTTSICGGSTGRRRWWNLAGTIFAMASCWWNGPIGWAGCVRRTRLPSRCGSPARPAGPPSCPAGRIASACRHEP